MNERDVDVAVVGAGFAGLYMLHRLRGLAEGEYKNGAVLTKLLLRDEPLPPGDAADAPEAAAVAEEMSVEKVKEAFSQMRGVIIMMRQNAEEAKKAGNEEQLALMKEGLAGMRKGMVDAQNEIIADDTGTVDEKDKEAILKMIEERIKEIDEIAALLD